MKSNHAPPLIGAHMSISGGPAEAIPRALSVGCTAMQVFVKNNMQWFAKPFTDEEVKAFTTHADRGKLAAVFGHTGYLINLAATNPEFHTRSHESLVAESLRADQLELPFLVLHPGAHMGAGVEQGIDRIVQSLDAVHAETLEVQTRIALETTAGQGSCVGHRFEHLAEILQRVARPDRLCICVDTAHLFAAGYDLTSEQSAAEVFAEFDRIVGLRHLVAIHCNDSKTGLGSHVDRHEALGKGKIGLPVFRFLMRDPRFATIPKVLETPKGKDLAEDRVNLAVLREML